MADINCGVHPDPVHLGDAKAQARGQHYIPGQVLTVTVVYSDGDVETYTDQKPNAKGTFHTGLATVADGSAALGDASLTVTDQVTTEVLCTHTFTVHRERSASA